MELHSETFSSDLVQKTGNRDVSLNTLPSHPLRNTAGLSQRRMQTYQTVIISQYEEPSPPHPPSPKPPLSSYMTGFGGWRDSKFTAGSCDRKVPSSETNSGVEAKMFDDSSGGGRRLIHIQHSFIFS